VKSGVKKLLINLKQLAFKLAIQVAIDPFPLCKPWESSPLTGQPQQIPQGSLHDTTFWSQRDVKLNKKNLFYFEEPTDP